MESQTNTQITESTRATLSDPARTNFDNYSGHQSTVDDPDSREDAEGRIWQNYRPDKYFLPNDSTEQDRLNLIHRAFCLQLYLLQDPVERSHKVEDALLLYDDPYCLSSMLGFAKRWKLHGAFHSTIHEVACLEAIAKLSLRSAPIKGDPPRVLDIGTGTGIWAIEFARCHPESQVIGADLSLIQPDVSATVPNVSFVRADAEEEWMCGAPFDLVHARLMFSCYVSHRDVIKRVFDNLNPGGWIEYQDNSFSIDSDDNSHRGTGLHQWGHLAQAGAAAKGRDFEAARKFKDYFVEAGFVDVVEIRCKVIGSAWPSTEPEQSLGRYTSVSSFEVVKNVSRKLLGEGGLGLPEDVIQPIVAQALKDVADPNIHFYWPGYIVYGRKPFAHEIASAPSSSGTAQH
ncbi:hypothetical protein PFICI_03334 [Pestalotiopsis fici W106-1]|uniref:Methyltransferase domain-containing protein n=1 Tax=Pestalotiopsis fici (strain W106-1 / CGMCC3.15140) TaxID=1229662 RepID=W3XH37_PESFW|nr:uncharacterized protein PFICI_03334 [Pestalotiopsis fici W106-1]ETS85309.1 hypothetical protein PFICI_03334 [Pestalotiopsis fici W106-1]